MKKVLDVDAEPVDRPRGRAPPMARTSPRQRYVGISYDTVPQISRTCLDTLK
jgi:hypothetical protein